MDCPKVRVNKTPRSVTDVDPESGLGKLPSLNNQSQETRKSLENLSPTKGYSG
jgi:hypothetical protein